MSGTRQITKQDIFKYWRDKGGSLWPFQQSRFLNDNPSVTTLKLKGDKLKRVTKDVSEGICHALSLRFVEGRLLEWKASRLMEMIESALPIIAVQQVMIESGKKSGSRAAGVKGSSIKSKGISKHYRPFNSRRELTDFLIGSPGLYEYGMYGAGGGHSVAFDSRPGAFFFFDANSGIWVMPDGITEADWLYPFIRAYWSIEGYKRDFNMGQRDMHQYA